MADENIYGVKFEVDIEDLKINMDEAKNKVKLANAEFNQASSTMSNWAEDVNGLQAKIKQLNTVLEAEKQKLLNQQKSYNNSIDTIDKYGNEIEDLKRKKQQAISVYGRESDEVQKLDKQIAKAERSQNMAKNSADKLRISIANQQATVNRTERSIGQYEQQLGEVKQAQKQAEKSGKSLADELKNIRNQSEQAGDGVSKMSGGFTIVKGAIANLVATGISNLISGLGNIIQESKETIENMGKLETAFTTSGHSAEAGKETYREMVGVLGEMDQAVEASNHLAKLTTNQEDLSKWTNIATGVYATFGDSLPLEGLTEASNETAKVGKVTGSLADALNWAGVSEDEFNQKLASLNTEQERSQLITNTLNGLYDEASQKYKEINKDLIESRQATSDMQEAQARLGQALLPVETAFKSFGATVLNTFMDLATGQISLDQFVQKVGTMVQNVISKVGELAPQMITKGTEMLVSLSEGFVTGFPNFTSSLMNILEMGLQYISDNLPTWIEKGFEVLSNFVQGIINAIPEMISRLPQIITTFVNIIRSNLPTIIMNGVELLWQFITGILSAIPTLIANIPAIIQAISTTLLGFDWLGLGIKIINFLGNGIQAMIGFIGSVSLNVATTIINFIVSLPGRLMELGSQMIQSLGSAISSGISWATNAIRNVADSIVNTIKSLPSKMLSIGSDLVKGLWNGISDMTGWIIGKIQGFGDSVLGGIKDFFGIHSPSKETYWMGEMLDLGLGNAIEDGTRSIVKKAKNMASSVLSSLKKEMEGTVPINTDIVTRLKGTTANALNGMRMAVGGNTMALAGAGTTNVTNVNFNQNITSPQPIDSLQVYKNTQRQIKQFKVWKGK